MKNILVIFSLFFLAIIINGCSSKGNVTPDTTPTNLVVNATAAQDNSGNVSIIATATNAVTYDIDFGDGTIQTVATGTITYKYAATGNYTINVIAKSSSGKTASASTQVAVTVTVARNLVWSDEFNTDGAPDGTKWGYDIGNGAGGWGNNELEYYTNHTANVFVQGGYLNIVAKKESYSDGNNNYAYTSARMLSKNKFSFKYGTVEIRAMLPAGLGTWPALWMLGSNIDAVGWPTCGEIDIMEQRGSELNKIYGTIHYPGHSGAGGISSTLTIQNATTQFHVYSLNWTATTIKIAVDGQEVETVANSGSLPFNANFFMIFNIAMGGNFGGTVDPAFTSATMQVDYIRIYQ